MSSPNPIVNEPYRLFLQNSSWYTHVAEGNLKELTYLTLGLGGEAGEFTDEIKKIVREDGFDGAITSIDGPTRRKLVLEIGDVLWYVTRLGDMLGLTIDDLMVLNTLKLFRRMHALAEEGKLPIDAPSWPFYYVGVSEQDAVEFWESNIGGRQP